VGLNLVKKHRVDQLPEGDYLGRPDGDRSPTPIERSSSVPRSDSPVLDLRMSGGMLSELEEVRRNEARKGNPNITYRISKRHLPNGAVYQRSTYKCQQCPYNHEKFEMHQKHMQGHMGQRQFQCNLCTYSSSVSASLGRHMRVHGHRLALHKSKNKLFKYCILANVKLEEA